MTGKNFGFGMIGAGTIAHIHAKAIQAIPNAHLVGICSTGTAKAEAFAKEHHCTVFSTLEDMLKAPGIDIVCICTPSGIHMEPALKCIEAGKHCLVEKPLEVTLERCDKMIEAAEKAGVKIGVVFPSRFYDESIRIRKAIDEDKFGKLAVGSAYVKWSRTEAYYQSAAWRGTWQYDGGGALMNQGIHSVDLLQWYMGPVEAVQAFSANIRHQTIEVEDTIVASLHFSNGAVGTLECSTAVYPGALKRIEIMGTDGTVVMEENNIIKWQFRTDEESLVLNSNTGKIIQGGVSNPADISFTGHQKQIEDFIAAIYKKTRPLVDGKEGRKAVEIVMAIYESARKGYTVKLNLP
ncbi:MAG: Gfo/Idh/MocA family oxidoreductase [Chitinophagaceae bacterium]|nr:Gfo/Idh/MocA family oxidoreductase [Chitinophagaceae bacterium]